MNPDSPSRSSRSPSPTLSPSLPGGSQAHVGIAALFDSESGQHGRYGVLPVGGQNTTGLSAPGGMAGAMLLFATIAQRSIDSHNRFIAEDPQGAILGNVTESPPQHNNRYLGLRSQYEPFLQGCPYENIREEEALLCMEEVDRELGDIFESLKGQRSWGESEANLRRIRVRCSNFLKSKLPFFKLYCDRLIRTQGLSLPACNEERTIISWALCNDISLFSPVVAHLNQGDNKSRLNTVLDSLERRFCKEEIIARLLGEYSEEEVLRMIPLLWLARRDYYEMFGKKDKRPCEELKSELIVRISQALSENRPLNELCELYMDVSQQMISQSEGVYNHYILEVNLVDLFGRILELVYQEEMSRTEDDLFVSEQPARAQILASAYLLKHYILGRSAYLDPNQRTQVYTDRKDAIRTMFEVLKSAPRFVHCFDLSPWLSLPDYLQRQVKLYACLYGFGRELSTLTDFGEIVQFAGCAPLTSSDSLSLSLPFTSVGRLAPEFYGSPSSSVSVSLSNKGAVVFYVPRKGISILCSLDSFHSDPKSIIKRHGLDNESLRVAIFPGGRSTMEVLEACREHIGCRADIRMVFVNSLSMTTCNVPFESYKKSGYLDDLETTDLRAVHLFIDMSQLSAVFAREDLTQVGGMKYSRRLGPFFEPQRVEGGSYLRLTLMLASVACSSLGEIMNLVEPALSPKEGSVYWKLLRLPNVKTIRDIFQALPASVRLSVRNESIQSDEVNDVLWCIREIVARFRCDITQGLVGDDGEYVYDNSGFPFDKAGLNLWCRNHNTNPRTREPMTYASAEQSEFMDSILKILLYLNELAPLGDLDEANHIISPVIDEDNVQEASSRACKRAADREAGCVSYSVPPPAQLPRLESFSSDESNRGSYDSSDMED